MAITRRARLAWFAPLPPVRSGIAAYNAELLPELARSYAIDVFVDRSRADRQTLAPCATTPNAPVNSPAAAPAEDGGAAEGRVRVLDAHEFVWRHAREPYDLVVYQLGNEACHDYVWPYLVRYPGLVVLHDGILHHARARALLGRRRALDYRAEFEFDHPRAVAGIAQVGVFGLLGALQYFYPMLRVPLDAARAAAVHSPWLAHDLGDEFPGVPIETIRMGVADPWRALRPERLGRDDTREPVAARTAPGERLRAQCGIPRDAVVFAAFGRLTPEKRLGQAIRAVARLTARNVPARLLLVGEPVPYYDVRAEIDRRGAGDLVTIAGYVADETVALWLDAADVCLCLRWPTARETSASWLRCLAAGKPTIVTDLAHTVDVPALDPRDWAHLPAASPGEGGQVSSSRTPDSGDPVCVAVDILDEDHSLGLAVDRLAQDPELRARLGAAARAHFLRRHTLAHMVEDYCRVIEVAHQQPTAARAPAPCTWPAHLLDDGSARAKTLLDEIGVRVDFLDG